MSKQYYLANNGTHIGPFSIETVLKKLEERENQWTDYVFDEAIGEWLMLLEHPEFSAKLSASSKELPHRSRHSELARAPLKDREWFILKDGNNYGPFCKLDLVQMLQEKTLFEYNYVWHENLPSWKRVADLEEFSPNNIRALKSSHDSDIAEIFFRRRHVRASYGATLIVHNNKSVFRGEAFEISAGGAGVLIENPNLQPGQSLFLHFQPGDGVPPFNAVCQIVSKQCPTEGRPVKYGVKFTTLSQSARESIKTYTSAKAA